LLAKNSTRPSFESQGSSSFDAPLI